MFEKGHGMWVSLGLSSQKKKAYSMMSLLIQKFQRYLQVGEKVGKGLGNHNGSMCQPNTNYILLSKDYLWF
jgi:hypothetical protein